MVQMNLFAKTEVETQVSRTNLQEPRGKEGVG